MDYHRLGIFTFKNNPREKCLCCKFSPFRLICKNFLTVDDCNMDECLETCWRLVYYQVSGEQGIARCSRRLDIYLREHGLACILFFACLIFVVGLDRDIILTVKFSRSTVTADCTTKKLLSCYQTLFLMRGWGLGADWCRPIENTSKHTCKVWE